MILPQHFNLGDKARLHLKKKKIAPEASDTVLASGAVRGYMAAAWGASTSKSRGGSEAHTGLFGGYFWPTGRSPCPVCLHSAGKGIRSPESRVQLLTPIIPALWGAKVGRSQGQKIETILANMVKLCLY